MNSDSQELELTTNETDAAPSADMFAQVKIYSFAYFGYSYMVGLCILLTLSLVIDMSIKTTGVIFGYEMGELFRNPAGASNIRTFWARCS